MNIFNHFVKKLFVINVYNYKILIRKYMKEPKILITGACGFVGTNLINDLITKNVITNPKENIIGIDNMSHGTFLEGVHDKITLIEDDIRYHDIKNHFKDVDYVFHFAGLVSIYDCDKNPMEAFSNNIMGSINVFDACIENNVKKVIFSETSAMYEDSKILPHVESEWNPGTIYATSKACLHLLAESYRKTKGLTYTGLRYFNIYGKLQDWKRTVPPASCGFAIRLLNGANPIVFGDGNRRRDFIHVDDVNRFHIQCIQDSRTDNEVFNLGTGQSYSLYEMIKSIANSLKINKYEINHLPEINGEAFEIYANIDKAKALGWEPQVKFDEGHEDLIGYLKDLYENGYFPKDYMDNINIEEVTISSDKK